MSNYSSVPAFVSKVLNCMDLKSLLNLFNCNVDDCTLLQVSNTLHCNSIYTSVCRRYSIDFRITPKGCISDLKNNIDPFYYCISVLSTLIKKKIPISSDILPVIIITFFIVDKIHKDGNKFTLKLSEYKKFVKDNNL
jgi:hypothetical protein